MEPVLEPSTVDLLSKEVRGRNLCEDEQRVAATITNFCGEADLGQGLNELDKGSFRSDSF